MRTNRRIESFWYEVARAAGVQNPVVGTRKKALYLTNELHRQGLRHIGEHERIHLEGLIHGFAIEAGVEPPSGESGFSGPTNPGYTYAAVTVTGLPPGFEVGRWREKPPRLWRSGAWVGCDGGGGREVAAAGLTAIRSEVGGLVIEQEIGGFDLDAFLTPRRREVICSLEGHVVITEGAHQIQTEFTGDPYPRRRDMARAARGDGEATQRLWEHANKVAGLLRTALRDAELVAVELTLLTSKPPE